MKTTVSGKKIKLLSKIKVFERIKEGIIILDGDGKITYTNKKTIDLLHEKSRKDVIGKSTFDTLLNDVNGDFIKAYEDALNNGKPTIYVGYYEPWDSYYENRIYPIPGGLMIYISDITNNLIIQQELEESLNIIEETEEIVHLGRWILDISSENFQWSDEIYRIFGLLKDNFCPTKKSFLRLVYPEDREVVGIWFDQSLAGIKPNAFEIRVVTPNGDIRWIWGDGRLVLNQKGKADQLVGFILDITERKKIELELANQDIRRQFLIEKSSDGITILDVNGKVIEANLRAAEMLGYTPEEFAQLSIPDWEKNLTLEELNKIIQNADEEGQVFETTHTRKDSSEINVEVSANGTFFQGKKLIFSVVRDISERKVAEEEAKKKQIDVEKIIKSSPIMIFILNIMEDNLEFLRLGMKNCLGYSDAQIEAMQGMYTEALFHPDDIDTYRNVTQKKYAALKDGETIEYEHRMKDSEGNWCNYFSKELVFSRNPDGTPAQIIGFGLDITNRK